MNQTVLSDLGQDFFSFQNNISNSPGSYSVGDVNLFQHAGQKEGLGFCKSNKGKRAVKQDQCEVKSLTEVYFSSEEIDSFLEELWQKAGSSVSC